MKTWVQKNKHKVVEDGFGLVAIGKRTLDKHAKDNVLGTNFREEKSRKRCGA